MYLVTGSDVCVGVWHLGRLAFLEAIEIHHRSQLSLNRCTRKAFSKFVICHTESEMQTNKSGVTPELRVGRSKVNESRNPYMTAVDGK